MNEFRKGQLILITGGVRSGKSTFAEGLAANSGKKTIYLATSRIEDDEMRERVARHRMRRPADMKTVEEAFKPDRVLTEEGKEGTFILIDCLTMLLSNRLLEDLNSHGAVMQGEDIFADEKLLKDSAQRVLSYIKNFAEIAKNCPADVVIVTNEVGMGVVPNYPVGRVFRDLSGWANQAIAAIADQVWLVICGIPQQIK
ncbi:MAG: bifunctional adenosylcobinamide kinase/adenosylcobinamide-phosphate guanylyltransferase [Bacillota bacterium]|nr:bifunctional adenosylcobinamide kinase/adenosylcobinamide-phosphate guanylyltransferase [Bacillota bacterium]